MLSLTAPGDLKRVPKVEFELPLSQLQFAAGSGARSKEIDVDFRLR